MQFLDRKPVEGKRNVFHVTKKYVNVGLMNVIGFVITFYDEFLIDYIINSRKQPVSSNEVLPKTDFY